MTELTQYVYAFDKANEPIARAKDGDEFSFRTLDCYSGQVCTEEDIVGESFNFSRTNPATGPLYVEGAMPGDVLVVDVLSVEVADKGAVTTIPNIGPLYDRCVDRTRILPVKDGKTELGGLSIPINPMIGVMGVAPAGEPIACGYAGKHGGNMDSKKLTAGSRVYLPVQVEGALLQMGDIHAVMGDCELCGTGLEIGGVITVRVSVLKGRKLDWPVIETADAWHVVSARKDYTSAIEYNRVAGVELPGGEPFCGSPPAIAFPPRNEGGEKYVSSFPNGENGGKREGTASPERAGRFV